MSGADPWGAAMRRGDWAAAWRIADAVLAARGGTPCGQLPRHRQWVWDGRPLAGRRVLVRCYHGLGDTLQFARLVPLLRAETTLWAQPALLPLLARMPGLGRLMPLHDGTPEGAWDAEIELLEVPHALRLAPRDVPAPPALVVAPAPLALPPGRRVGLVWRAGEWDPARSVPFAALRRAVDRPGLVPVVLQRGPGRAEAPAGFGHDLGDDDPLIAAARLRALDLLVSVDSMPAHLAGALGVPVLLLLRRQADWRWMAAATAAPWYPATRLFRQREEGDWSAPLAALAEALASG